ncbi:EAL domain-containing response regulator [Vibrio kasasachensis]
MSKLILKHNDYDIMLACDGNEALEKIKDSVPELIICDLYMPKMDGISFLSHLSEIDSSPSVIIVSATSVAVLDTVREMCNSYKIDLLGILPKPFCLTEFGLLLDTKRKQNRNKSNISENTSLKCFIDKNEIISCLENGSFILHFQPIVAIDNGAVFGYEALSRLPHPKLGIVMPGDYIEHIECLGLSTKLAISNVNFIVDNLSSFKGCRVALNISANTLVDLEFIRHIEKLILDKKNVFSILYFEITESDIIGEVGKALEVASRFSMHGIDLSIDDFGTGHSSFKQLDQLPFKSLKIDKGFVKNIKHEKSLAIIEACLLLGNRLSIGTIAEGIETKDSWYQLRSMGCQLGQGYYIAKPMHILSLSDWANIWDQKIIDSKLCE